MQLLSCQFLFAKKPAASNSLLAPPVGYDTYHESKKRKRDSISEFFQQLPSPLKRKRSFEDTHCTLVPQQDQQGTNNKRKKTNTGTMTRIFQKMVHPHRSTTSSSSRQTYSRKQSLNTTLSDDEFVDIFQKMQLPSIEWTSGDLGILSSDNSSDKESTTPTEEDSIFCIDTEFMEFPVPPKQNTFSKRRMRQDSCPSRFHSLIIIEEDEDSDDDSNMPTTPSASEVAYDTLLVKTDL